ncbi:MAG: hypothetical protein J6K24_00855 [Tidjanibacter sp.]|nr:hypothetical protein [Tidjanibacter sp.]
MKMMKTLALAVMAIAAFTSCASKNECKFNEKEYAERKTAHLNEIVNLTDEQQKEIYNIFEAQGLEIKENIKNMKCNEAECKKAECDKAACEKKAECKKAECDKANCEKKAECKKAQCDKVNCEKKAECKKAECDKAACEKKAECKKAECDKAACEKKAECNKAECDKANCEKKAECDKANCDKKAACDKKHHHRKHHMVSPEKMKETFEKINAVLTPEQQEALKAHHANRRNCAASMKECCPNGGAEAPAAK